mmetsp:Transcript_120371/g.286015  ORF Transcript_120371/g.286015 Transcript_120371/m.286015 type:complete len:1363 (-) Transcript_120371:278-4366(-)
MFRSWKAFLHALGLWLALGLRKVLSVDAKPVCDAVPVPPVTGYVSQGNLHLDAGCRYNLYEKAQATQCLQGSWIVMAGTSSLHLQFQNLINFLAPDEHHIKRDGEWFGEVAGADVVIENGQVIHWEVINDPIPECRPWNITLQSHTACKRAFNRLLDRAPLYSPGSFRITYFSAFFWHRTSLALEVVGEDRLWNGAKVGVVVQVGAWYNLCIDKFDNCPRKELMTMERDLAVQLFKDEMEEAFHQMGSFCMRDGRAQLGCSVQTGPRPADKVLNAYIEQAVASRQSSSFRLVDYIRLGQGMPTEVVRGHGSQMLNLWAWTIMLNAMCPANLAAPGSFAVWEGLCSATEARFENCPNYWPTCLLSQRCEKWECMNNAPCTLTARDPPVGGTEGLCDDSVDIADSAHSHLALMEMEWADSDACHRGGVRIRLWCLQHFEWFLPVISVLAALGVVAVQHAWAAWSLKTTVQHGKQTEDPTEDSEDAAEFEPDAAVPIEFPEFPETAYHDEPDIKPNAVELNGLNGFNADLSPCNMEAPKPPEVTPPEGDLEKGDSLEVGKRAGCAGESFTWMLQTCKAGNRYPFGLARFMASTHIVLGNLFAKGVTQPVYFFCWGFTWVPWFFMLSGFVLFSAYLKNPKEESMIQYVLRRSATIYPLYAISLIPAFIMQKSFGTMTAEWPTLLAQSFLLQAWWPTLTESALQTHCWFLSCMVVYWFFFKPIARALMKLDLLETFLLMSLSCFLPWLVVFVPAVWNQPMDWYKDHHFLSTDTALDLGVVMLKFHPLCYFHVFILGMLLAKLRQLLDQKALAYGADSRNPYLIALQLVAPLGYLFLLLVFNFEGFQAKVWGSELSARLSVLMPFQAMILFGLAGLPSLPLPLFSYAFSKLEFLENYSYAVYVLQFLCYAVWPKTGLVSLPLFLIFLYASAVLIVRCIQQPSQKWWANHTTARLFVPFILAASFVGLSFLPDPVGTSTSMPDIPAQRWIDNRSKDMRLELLDPEGQRLGARIINPSLAIADGQLVVVARRHRREVTKSSGRFRSPEGEVDAVFINQIWHSDLVVGSHLDLDLWPSGPGAQISMQSWTGLRTSTGGNWEDLCVAETWIAKNNTVIRHIVTGPQDPKVVSAGAGGLAIAFDSNPPKSDDGILCQRNAQGFADAATQMYLAMGFKPAKPGAPTAAYRLGYGHADVAEKSWIPFIYKESVFFIYTPLPHVVLSSTHDGQSEKVFSTTFRPLLRVLQDNPHVRIRGSAQAVFVHNSQETPNLARPHYLALLHMFDTSTGRYAHYAYRFAAEPPFMMLQLSSKLPLMEAAATPGGVPFAFASGLAVHNNTVVITYGAGHRDVRALVMTLDRLDEMFACSVYVNE